MKTKRPKEKYRYCFPNFLAKAMANVDMKTQMQSSMLSQFLLLIGLTVMVCFMVFSKQMTGFYKFMVIFNLLAGWLLITSYLITTYQQYVSYAGAIGYNPQAEKAAIKRKGNIFKRIILAIKKKKKLKSSGLVPLLVNDALKNMDKAEGTQKQLEKIPKENSLIESKGGRKNG